MIGPGGVVTRRLRRIIADEDRSRVADMCQVFVAHGDVGAGFLLLHDPACRCKRKTSCGRRAWLKGAHEPVVEADEWLAYRRRLLPLAARDLTGEASFDQVAAELADLAAAALEAALAIAGANLPPGSAPCRLAVIAMGRGLAFAFGRSISSSLPPHMATARSMVFSSTRTLPGQS